jgi:DNA-binding protein YbaB
VQESLQEQIDKARADLEAAESAVARAEGELRDSAVTTRSKDRSVEVTVGPQGELQSLKFLADKYKTMEAAELSASVIEAAEKARARMARRVMDAFSPVTQYARPAAEVPEGTPRLDVDWERVFGSLVTDPPDKRRASRRSDDGLRDEINEES